MNRLYAPVLIAALISLLSISLLSPKQIQPWQLGRGDIGRQAMLSGVALGSRQITNGTIVTLYNYSTIDVLMPSHEVLPGDLISARGKVKEYKGKIELIAESADVTKPDAMDLAIGGITDRTVHKAVRTAGEVRDKKGNTFKIYDDTGEIYVFSASDIPEGAAIEIEGLVERYKSVLYIRPREITRLS